MKRFAVLETVNPNAHNPCHGRDCHAAPTVAGYVYADTWQQAMRTAEEQGYGYQPDAGRYNHLLHSVRQVPLF